MKVKKQRNREGNDVFEGGIAKQKTTASEHVSLEMADIMS